MERLFFRFKAGYIPFVIFVVLVVSACAFIGEDDEEGAAAVDPNAATNLGDQTVFAAGSQAVLVCSQACRDVGFCGTLPNGGDAVLMSLGGPTAEIALLNAFEPANSAVIINEIRTENAVLRVNPELNFTVNYYKITTAGNLQAWAAGYCVGQALPQ